MEPDLRGTRIGPVWFQPGIRRGDAVALLAMVVTNISMITWFVFMQPYLLVEILHVPAGRQGTLTGMLGSFQEILSLSLMSVAGALADTAGRRRLAAAGFLLVATGFFLNPLAGSESGLFLVRVVYGVGVAVVPVVLTAAVVSYVQELSRGKWSSMVSVCNSLAIVFVTVVMAKLPKALTASGMSAAQAGTWAYWTGALLSAAVIPLAWLRLRDGAAAVQALRGSLRSRLYQGLALARENPRLPVAYAAGLIGRGDLIVISTFLSLWVVHAGTVAGVATATSMARAGMVFGLVQTSALLWAPVMGMLVDRINRLSALVVAMALAAAGYTLMGQVHDPFGPLVFAAAVLMGIGENSVLIASIAVVGQETPPHLHGTSVGMFLVLGALGVILANSVGGTLFDHWSATGPFTMMGVLNSLIFAWALTVRLRRPAPA